MPLHTCPVCGKGHEVHAVQHGLAYGRPLCCSPHCKMLFREVVRARIFAELKTPLARVKW